MRRASRCISPPELISQQADIVLVGTGTFTSADREMHPYIGYLYGTCVALSRSSYGQRVSQSSASIAAAQVAPAHIYSCSPDALVARGSCGNVGAGGCHFGSSRSRN